MILNKNIRVWYFFVSQFGGDKQILKMAFVFLVIENVDNSFVKSWKYDWASVTSC